MAGSFRGVAAAFNAIVMVGAAVSMAPVSFPDSRGDLVVLWGSAGAAVIAALIVLANGPSLIGWAAVGYIAAAGALTPWRTHPLPLLLALAFIPLLQRPRGSILLGLAVLVVSAVAVAVLAAQAGPPSPFFSH